MALRSRCSILVVLLAGGAVALGAAGAQSRGGGPSSERLDQAVFYPITGTGCAVRYTAGGLDRASHVLRRLEILTSWFNAWSDLPTPTVVYLLNREEWSRAELPETYGVPLRVAPSSVLAPSAGDAGTVSFWRRRLNATRLPLIYGVPLSGTEEEAASMAIADLLLQTEASRGFVQRSGLFGRQPWVAELMAHTAARVIFNKHEADRLVEIDQTYRQLGDGLGGPASHPIEGFQPGLPLLAGKSLDRWLWYQAQFHEGARLLLAAKGGKKAIKRLTRMSQEGGGRLSAAELLATYPELGRWVRTAFAPLG